MQPSTNANIAAVQTGQVILAQRPPLNVRVIRALAITQIVLGGLSLILSIILFVAMTNYHYGIGIWFVVGIIVTGIFGIFATRKPQNDALNSTNMGFNIFSSVVSLLNASLCAMALGVVQYYDDYGGMVIYSLLMLLMIAEFFVSLFISIYCRKGSSCCGSSCCGSRNNVIIVENESTYIMQSSTNVNIAAVQTGQVVLTQRPPSTLNVRVIRALAITQIVFGVLSFLLGIFTFWLAYYMMNFIGFGVWFGVWIIVTGIIGICSARKPQNGGLNGTNMGFNIFCSVVSIINGSFFAVAVAYHDQCRVRQYDFDNYGYYVPEDLRHESYVNLWCKSYSTGLTIYSLQMALMIAELFVSLAISIYCCKSCSCGGGRSNDQGVMLLQSDGYSANGSAVTTTNYSSCQTTPDVFSQQGQVLEQQNPQQSQMMIPQNPQHEQNDCFKPGMTAGQTSAVYVSAQQPEQPPDYQKPQLDHADINTPQ